MLKIAAKPPKKKSITLKLTEKEIEYIKEKSQQYTAGNMSAWLRYAGMRHEPKKGELIEV